MAEEKTKKEQVIIASDEITGKNLNDLFALPCVRSIMKRDDGTFVFKVKLKPRTYEYAHVGDTLVEFEDHTFGIVRSGNYKLN